MKQKKTTNLKRRVYLVGVTSAVITFLLYVVIMLIMRRMTFADLQVHNDSMVEIVSEQILHTVELPVNLIRNVNELIEKAYSIDEKIVRDYLETIQSSYVYFTDIHVVDLEGNIINTAPYNERVIGTSVLDQPYFYEEGMNVGEEYWSEVYISSITGMPTLSVTISENGYILIADLDLEKLPVSLNPDNYFSEIQTITILDQWGSYIISEDFKQVKDRKRYDLFDEIKESDTGSNTITRANDTISYRIIDKLQWYLVYEFDYEEIYRTMNRFSLFVMGIWLILIGVLIIVVRRYFKQVTEELTYLQKRSHSMTNNAYDAESDVMEMRFTEFDALNNEFTMMMNAIEERENRILRINEGLARSVQEAEKANIAKSAYLSVMSHEMRGPLNGIIGFMQMIEKTNLNQEQKEIVDIVNGSTRTLVALINDILDIEKYSAGKMLFEEEVVSLKRLLKEECTMYAALINAKDISFEAEIDDSLNQLVYVDDLKLEQLIGNLISNAIKFTSEGHIKVLANAEIINQSLKLHIEVSDTGIGIKDEVRPYLFSPFTQADGSIAHKYGGTGLGLTICKEIVLHYNGVIDYKSIYNEGTTFSVDLLLEIAHKTQLKNPNVDLKVKGRKSKIQGKILIAEDNKVNQKLLSKYLKNVNIDFDIADNGETVLEMLAEERYEIIFMDCQMPIKDGFETTKEIRKLYGNGIEIMAMTGYASKIVEQRCYDAGMDRFMTKPVDLKLLDKILGVKSMVNKREEIVNKKSILDQEVKILMEKINFDYEMCYDLLTTYIDQVKKGIREIEMHHNNNDFEQLSNKLHQLKGASAAVRLIQVQAQFEEAETLIELSKYDEALEIVRAIIEEPLFGSI